MTLFLVWFLWIYIIIQVCFSLLKYLFCWINTDISIPQNKWGEMWRINKCTACWIDLNLFRGVKSRVFSQGKLLMHSCKNIQVMKQHEQIFLMVKWYIVWIVLIFVLICDHMLYTVLFWHCVIFALLHLQTSTCIKFDQRIVLCSKYNKKKVLPIILNLLTDDVGTI